MSLTYGDELTILASWGYPMTGTYVHRYQTTIGWERVTRYVIAKRAGNTYHGSFISSTRRTDEERAEALRRYDKPAVADLCAPWLGPARPMPAWW